MNKKKKKIEFRYIAFTALIIVIIVIAILSYSLNTNKKLNTFESIIKDLIVEIQKITYYPFKNFGGMIQEYNDLKNVYKENKILKDNIEKYETIKAENIELKKELEDMKKELKVDYALSNYDYLNATVISRNAATWYNNLTIDKGSHNGIKEGMVVINSTGVIGKTTNVSTFTSDVRLITTTNTNNKISIKIASGDKKLTGIINKYDYKTGYLEVEGISNTDNVSIGDLVYTSGLGGVFPGGVLVGKVANISTDVYDLSKIINVTPAAKFEDINYVTVLKRVDKK
ncbi:MAG: rod shape-determining protein MreC [Bacilli bacterium]|nr:rod shape-determining protein MreC [Bacilli bacterium]